MTEPTLDKLLSQLPRGTWELRGPMWGDKDGPFFNATFKPTGLPGHLDGGNWVDKYIYARAKSPNLAITKILGRLEEIRVKPPTTKPRVMTRQEAGRLGGAVTGKIQTKKTHCPKGHPYLGSNLYITRQGWRACRQCNVERELKTKGK